MTAADKIALVAAIAAVISTAISLAAFYVAWLTRRDAREKEKAESQPHFNWRDGADKGMACEANFENIGGDVSEISISTDNSDVRISINPQNHIPKNGMGQVSFQKRNGPRSFPVLFTINCKTKLGESWEKSFQLREWAPMPKIVEA
jgi:hypothetical protein